MSESTSSALLFRIASYDIQIIASISAKFQFSCGPMLFLKSWFLILIQLLREKNPNEVKTIIQLLVMIQ